MNARAEEIILNVYNTEHMGGNLEHQNKNKTLKYSRENKKQP